MTMRTFRFFTENFFSHTATYTYNIYRYVSIHGHVYIKTTIISELEIVDTMIAVWLDEEGRVSTY